MPSAVNKEVSFACLIDGKVATHIDSRDRGLAFGDGLFETLRVTGNNVEFFNEHWQRFQQGCARLRLPPPRQNDFRNDIKNLLTDGTYVIKWIYTRGSGGRGYGVPTEPVGRRIVMRVPFDTAAYQKKANEGVNVRYGTISLAHQPQLAGIKHLNRLENVLARMEWQDDTISESLLFDQNDNLIEGVLSNVFVYVDGGWHTPDLQQCGIDGVMRKIALEALNKRGVDVRVGILEKNTLARAESIFLTNSLMPIWFVTRCQDRTLTIRDDMHILQQDIARQARAI